MLPDLLHYWHAMLLHVYQSTLLVVCNVSCGRVQLPVQLCDALAVHGQGWPRTVIAMSPRKLQDGLMNVGQCDLHCSTMPDPDLAQELSLGPWRLCFASMFPAWPPVIGFAESRAGHGS